MGYSALPQTDAEFHLLRNKLVMYFVGRRLSPAEDYADEVIMRAVTKISDGEEVEDINKYVFGIAKFVKFEAFRAPKTVPLGPSGEIVNVKDESKTYQKILDDLIVNPTTEEEGLYMTCLKKCLRRLKPDQTEFLLAFYETSGKEVAKRHGLTKNATYVKVHHLRKKVGDCARKCADE